MLSENMFTVVILQKYVTKNHRDFLTGRRLKIVQHKRFENRYEKFFGKILQIPIFYVMVSDSLDVITGPI